VVDGKGSRWTNIHTLRDWLRRWGLAVLSYLLLSLTGVFVFTGDPSPTLLSQGGPGVVITWGLFCLVGGLFAGAGFLIPYPPLEIAGLGLGVTASLTWCVALVLQAMANHATTSLTAACMAAVLALAQLQRCIGLWSQR
jgi:hypothetical protein